MAKTVIARTITATMAGAISMLANFALFFGRGRDNPLGIIGTIAMMVLAPVAAMLVQMAISRTREYAADRGGAEICGEPMWLAGALMLVDAVTSTMELPLEGRMALLPRLGPLLFTQLYRRADLHRYLTTVFSTPELIEERAVDVYWDRLARQHPPPSAACQTRGRGPPRRVAQRHL